MTTVRGSTAVWRATFQTLRQDFRQGAEAFPTLQHVILRALDDEGTIPPSLERAMRDAGGWSEGELRGRWELAETAKDLTQPSYLAWLTLNSPAKRGFLTGELAARNKFEFLAKRAWLAIPGTKNGKAEKFPQPRVLDRWLAFVYHQLDQAPSSYLSVEDELLVCDFTKRGCCVEHRFAPHVVKNGTIVQTGYPDAVGLSRRARRWIHTALATDPFTASTIAIDMLLADRHMEGPFLVSEQEFDALDSSEDFVVEYLRLGKRRFFPIYRDSCKPVPGSRPTICPNADPPSNDADRKVFLAFLPRIAQRFCELNLIEEGQTIHWVGRQASLGTVCTCFPPVADLLLPPWISFDDDKSKVTIVGQGSHTIEDEDAYKVFRVIASAGPDLITSNQILQKVFGSKAGGPNKLCAVLKKLPQQVQDLIEWKQGAQGGRRLKLPSAKKSDIRDISGH